MHKYFSKLYAALGVFVIFFCLAALGGGILCYLRRTVLSIWQDALFHTQDKTAVLQQREMLTVFLYDHPYQYWPCCTYWNILFHPV
jgi:integral membrane sensor domain MASE1